MNNLLIWETTVEDVENVLGKMGEDIALAPELFNNLDCEAIARSAMNSEPSIGNQVDAAYDEIENQIRRKL